MKKLSLLVLSAALTVGIALPASAQNWQRHGYDRWDDRDHDRDHDRNRSDAYRDGYRQGLYDAEHRGHSQRPDRWRKGHDRHDWDSGYQDGFRSWRDRRSDDRGPYNPGNPGYPGYPGRGPNGGYQNAARDVGYQDGVNDGTRDRQTGHSFRPTEQQAYKNADHNYNSAYGDKQTYKNNYRQAYTQGYQIGYYGRGR